LWSGWPLKPSPLHVYELSGPWEPMTSMMTSAVPYAFQMVKVPVEARQKGGVSAAVS
jgi:hypothetical protein